MGKNSRNKVKWKNFEMKDKKPLKSNDAVSKEEDTHPFLKIISKNLDAIIKKEPNGSSENQNQNGTKGVYMYKSSHRLTVADSSDLNQFKGTPLRYKSKDSPSNPYKNNNYKHSTPSSHSTNYVSSHSNMAYENNNNSFYHCQYQPIQYVENQNHYQYVHISSNNCEQSNGEQQANPDVKESTKPFYLLPQPEPCQPGASIPSGTQYSVVYDPLNSIPNCQQYSAVYDPSTPITCSPHYPAGYDPTTPTTSSTHNHKDYDHSTQYEPDTAVQYNAANQYNVNQSHLKPYFIHRDHIPKKGYSPLFIPPNPSSNSNQEEIYQQPIPEGQYVQYVPCYFYYPVPVDSTVPSSGEQIYLAQPQLPDIRNPSCLMCMHGESVDIQSQASSSSTGSCDSALTRDKTILIKRRRRKKSELLNKEQEKTNQIDDKSEVDSGYINEVESSTGSPSETETKESFDIQTVVTNDEKVEKDITDLLISQVIDPVGSDVNFEEVDEISNKVVESEETISFIQKDYLNEEETKQDENGDTFNKLLSNSVVEASSNTLVANSSSNKQQLKSNIDLSSEDKNDILKLKVDSNNQSQTSTTNHEATSRKGSKSLSKMKTPNKLHNKTKHINIDSSENIEEKLLTTHDSCNAELSNSVGEVSGYTSFTLVPNSSSDKQNIKSNTNKVSENKEVDNLSVMEESNVQYQTINENVEETEVTDSSFDRNTKYVNVSHSGKEEGNLQSSNDTEFTTSDGDLSSDPSDTCVPDSLSQKELSKSNITEVSENQENFITKVEEDLNIQNKEINEIPKETEVKESQAFLKLNSLGKTNKKTKEINLDSSSNKEEMLPQNYINCNADVLNQKSTFTSDEFRGEQNFKSFVDIVSENLVKRKSTNKINSESNIKTENSNEYVNKTEKISLKVNMTKKINRKIKESNKKATNKEERKSDTQIDTCKIDLTDDNKDVSSNQSYSLVSDKFNVDTNLKSYVDIVSENLMIKSKTNKIEIHEEFPVLKTSNKISQNLTDFNEEVHEINNKGSTQMTDLISEFVQKDHKEEWTVVKSNNQKKQKIESKKVHFAQEVKSKMFNETQNPGPISENKTEIILHESVTQLTNDTELISASTDEVKIDSCDEKIIEEENKKLKNKKSKKTPISKQSTNNVLRRTKTIKDKHFPVSHEAKKDSGNVDNIQFIPDIESFERELKEINFPTDVLEKVVDNKRNDHSSFIPFVPATHLRYFDIGLNLSTSHTNQSSDIIKDTDFFLPPNQQAMFQQILSTSNKSMGDICGGGLQPSSSLIAAAKRNVILVRDKKMTEKQPTGNKKQSSENVDFPGPRLSYSQGCRSGPLGISRKVVPPNSITNRLTVFST